jgi:porphobilinogen synthase
MEAIKHPLTQRRLRTGVHIRELSAGVHLNHKSFVQPLFVEEGIAEPRNINGLPGIQVQGRESILNTIEQCLQNGIHKFLLFPVPAGKQEPPFNFSFATSVIKKIKAAFGSDCWLAADTCLCSYTTHGHCGLLNEQHSALLNNETVSILAKYAALMADAGADCIAPSDMTDGRIAAIRNWLDTLQFDQVSIMSYSAKFSSQWYGPFRDACHSAPNSNGLQNRKTYQLSPFNLNDALASALRDEQEGADILMVKPAGQYTDVIAALRQQTLKPLAAYHVSGEYAAIELMAKQGLLQREAAHLEVWTALQRAGANIIISYAASHAKSWIAQMEY